MSQGIIDIQNKSVVSKAGYAFDPNDELWVFSRDITISLGWAYETLSE